MRALMRHIAKKAGIIGVPGGDIFFYLNSESLASYPESGTVWTDLINGKQCNFVGATTNWNSVDRTIQFPNEQDSLSIVGGLPVDMSSGGNSFSAYFRIISFNPYGNAGFWRNVNSSFNIMRSTSGYFWTRWLGVDILKPLTGTRIFAGDWVYVTFTEQIGGKARIYVNGNLTHESTLNCGNQINFTLTSLNWQASIRESIFADYKTMEFYHGVLTPEQVLGNYEVLKASFGH